MTEWRPADWGIILHGYKLSQDFPNIFEAGASAMLSALLEWLWEPCTEHPREPERMGTDLTYWNHGLSGVYYKHRKDCPRCMAELRGEK